MGTAHCNWGNPAYTRTDCQKLTGTGLSSIGPVAAKDFHIRAGKPKVYIKTARSSGHQTKVSLCRLVHGCI
ncbi:glutathione-dependent formaldehyde-activating enzyme [Phyllobacterium bourgognense]|uniref:Glutathione-dependent formaldehyde-activating enzyme n=1 Tax=Phyllobacterium bourgognense TaxID=314236 RepID=A0A368YS74_9HYPH|nr:glutathione-dependent formaldehyde-activating enzyme [Phyllobacterium bourgognense]